MIIRNMESQAIVVRCYTWPYVAANPLGPSLPYCKWPTIHFPDRQSYYIHYCELLLVDMRPQPYYSRRDYIFINFFFSFFMLMDG
jgi:hypothetical protein